MNVTAKLGQTIKPNNDYNPAEVATYIAMEVLIAILAVVGNGLVLMAIWKFRSLRTATHWFVACLAVADIAVATFAIPSAILLRLGLAVTHSECNYVVEGPSVAEGTCLVIITSVIFLTQVSIFSLAVIAVDRFIAINYPFKYQSLMTSKKLMKISIATVWIVSALIGLVPQLGWNQWVHGDSLPCDRRRCAFEEVISMEYMVYFNFFGCVLLPLLIMGVIYILIFRSAKKQLRRIYFDVKSLKSRSRSVEFLQHIKVATSEISVNFQAKRKSRCKSQLRDDVTNSRLNVDAKDVPLTVSNGHSKSADSLHRHAGINTMTKSNSFAADDSDPSNKDTTLTVPEKTQTLRQNRSSVSESDMRFSENIGKYHSTRKKSSSFSIPNYASHSKSAKSLIFKKQSDIHIDIHPASTNSSRSTVYTTDYVADDNTISKINEVELRRKMKRKKQLLKKEFRAARSLATVVCVFAFCWLPLHIMNTFTVLCPSCYQPPWATDLAILLSHANSMVNPFIYACSMQDYRKAFRKILSCFFASKSCCSFCYVIDDSNTPETSTDDKSNYDRSRMEQSNSNFNNCVASPDEGYPRNEQEHASPLLYKPSIECLAMTPPHPLPQNEQSSESIPDQCRLSQSHEISDLVLTNSQIVTDGLLASKETVV